MRLIDCVRSSKHDECQVQGIHLILLGFDDLQVIEELVGTQRGSLCIYVEEPHKIFFVSGLGREANQIFLSKHVS
jgi:hypothetical protein